MKKKYLLPAFLVLAIGSLFVGVQNIGISDILVGNLDKINVLILTRIPRLISIISAGAGMSIAGVIMQQISNNKFVSPTTAATNDSAKLGVLVAMVLFPSATLVHKTVSAFIFALLGTFLFMKIYKKIKIKNVIFIPLVGIMLGNVIGSITDFVAYKNNLIQSIGTFMQGNFSMVIKGNYEMLYLIIPLIIVAFLYAKKFTIISMGEGMAANLGLNYQRVCNIGVSLVAVISALVVITVGNIPFIGLIIPNIVSIFMGDNFSDCIFETAIFGASFVLICDIIGRLIIYPYEVPISLTVGVIGSVIFLYLIFRRNKNGK